MSIKSRSSQINAASDRNANPLQEIELFNSLQESELQAFYEEMEVRTFTAGRIVYSPEDASTEQLHILKSGRIDIYRLTPGGKRLVTRRVYPGSVFGVMGLLGRTMQGNFAEAGEPSVTWMVTRERVLALLRRNPDLALRVLEILGTRLRLLEERLVETAYSSVTERLTNFLLANADATTGTLPRITHEQIANTIGAVRQTVTETLGLMRARGFIAIERRQIQIIDRKGLADMVSDPERQQNLKN